MLEGKPLPDRCVLSGPSQDRTRPRRPATARGFPRAPLAASMSPAAPLTSSQGILGILGHGIGFIQDHQFKAFPRENTQHCLENSSMSLRHLHLNLCVHAGAGRQVHFSWNQGRHLCSQDWGPRPRSCPALLLSLLPAFSTRHSTCFLP